VSLRVAQVDARGRRSAMGDPDDGFDDFWQAVADD
jgi:hypothetical protein